MTKTEKYKPAFDDIARWACIQGATNERLAFLFQVSISSIDSWLKKKPSFREAVHHGRAIATAEVAGKLYTLATGYTRTKQVAQKLKTVQYDEKGKKVSEEERIVMVDLEEQVGPDPASVFFYLKNKDPENWKNTWDHTVTPGGGLGEFLAEIAKSSSHVPPHLQGKDSTPA